MNYDFSKKVVLVTGASAGIGEGIALLMAKLGAQLALVGRNEHNLNSVAERCRQEPGVRVLPIVADLGTDEGCEKTAKMTIDHYGRLDVLVNNAGNGAVDTIEQADMEVFDSMFRVNLRGVYNLTRLVAPALIESKGNIVNISSVAMVYLGTLSLSMCKVALDHFTRLIALELAPKGVRVNAVSPGATISTAHQRLTGVTDDDYRKYIERTTRQVPMGAMCTPEDIAKMVVHLASDHSRLVTGTNVEVDGAIRFSNPGNIMEDTAN